ALTVPLEAFVMCLYSK
ncbi:DUF1196 domain-containing protein, partial [Vibrio cholerae]|nr:DUF1196 domain-containing protein [Vibrio cholerae]EGR4181326.1 DUF1196 domain-containing protein [Vibrio cholerae]